MFEQLVGRLQEKLVVTGKKVLQYGLVSGTWGNLSVRLPEEKMFVITPSGMGYDQVAGNDMVVVDFAGKVVLGFRKPSTETPLHTTLYRLRPDIGAIVHTHSLYASAFAAARKPIPPILEETAQVIGGEIPVADYALPGSKVLGDNAAMALGKGKAVLLANHGVIGVGSDLDEAFKVCLVVEKTAQVFLAASQLGGAVTLSQEEVAKLNQQFKTEYGQKNPDQSPGYAGYFVKI